jgi:tetratricopeptide (TPR) repeat protein
VRQFFMREFAEEASQLQALSEELEGVKVLVTYNGKSFDVPLLETRYRMARRRPPFDEMPHLDLLYGARRLWRLRFESCKLTELEARILGHEREGDIPGELIPQVYFDYVRSGRAERLAAVFHHNALDIISLACLTGIVPWAFTAEGPARHLTHAAELVAFARYLRQTERLEEARTLFRRALAGNLRDDLAWRTMWDVAQIEKQLGDACSALAAWEELAGFDNPHRQEALVELAKHAEHKAKNHARALELTLAAMALADSPELQRRRSRLERRLGSPRLL